VSTVGDDDWLFRQCQRISDALNKGEIALAQIYGLRIPIGELDDYQLKRLAADRFTKWSFNPDEPRVPKGSPQGGEWTTGDGGSEAPVNAFTVGTTASSNVGDSSSDAIGDGGGDDGDGDDSSADALASLLDADPAESILPTDDAGGNANGSLAPATPRMQYQFIGPAAGAGIPATAAAATVGATDGAATTLLGPLSAETLAGLAELAVQMAGPTLFFGILFIPTNGSPAVEGTVAGAPELSTSYNADTGIIQVWRDGGPLGAQILLGTGHIGVDGLFYDQNGTAIGRALPNGAIVDPETLPSYRSQSGTAAGVGARAQAITDAATQPKLCPDPGPDQPGARPKDIEYQQYISMLVNGRVLPPGLAVNLVNPTTGNIVHFDDCQLTTGIMIDAKGTRYADQLRYAGPQQGIDAWFLNEATRQTQAAGSRPIEWYFAEQLTAHHVRELFNRDGISIRVIYVPWIK
jgi:hypothetical protein